MFPGLFEDANGGDPAPHRQDRRIRVRRLPYCLDPSPERGLGGSGQPGSDGFRSRRRQPPDRQLHRSSSSQPGPRPAGFCLSAARGPGARACTRKAPPMRTLLTVACAVVALACPAAASAIVGGSAAKPGSYPFVVTVGDTTAFYCGGTLIAPDVVLTAAHCLTDRRTALAQLRVSD